MREPIEDLHAQIMNLQVSAIKMDGAVGRCIDSDENTEDFDRLYKEGHRDARHQAAELALSYTTKLERKLKIAEELLKEAERVIANAKMISNDQM